MSTTDFLVIWLVCSAFIFCCRMLPVALLQGRSLPPRVEEALSYIPTAVFAALVANDLLSPTMFASGVWPGLMPLVASAVVCLIAAKTKSMLWCCVGGIAAYIALSLL